jgi:hypothetical protein
VKRADAHPQERRKLFWGGSTNLEWLDGAAYIPFSLPLGRGKQIDR